MKLNNEEHRSGYVNIIGLPNVGKSTLMNFLLEDKLSIVTHKPQTTRHRILGILSGDDYQMILSDVPGYVEDESYSMHRKMNAYVSESFQDADVLMVMIEPGDRQLLESDLIDKITGIEIPKFLVVNKIDKYKEEDVDKVINDWKEKVDFKAVFAISALQGKGVEDLFPDLLEALPPGPAYFPKDQISNKDVRFFVSEMIREQIFLQFRQEIPYSCQVDIESYKELEDIHHIEAMIYVNRKTQKSILIGKGGESIKNLGIASRKRIEEFVGKKVFLKLHIKVREKWRDNDNLLERFGY
ncbi:GTPase Era [Membranihabitans marinus]|uniref:GTPase Era n=1 Tax=Membranihabitans marinus TaxID=1227546 RepID=UPI001F01E78E|nr:GTPase Era [Membranihabitans marinus]